MRTANDRSDTRHHQAAPVLRSPAIRLLCVLALLLPGPAAAGPKESGEFKVKEALDVRYAPGGGSRHTLDVFYPKGVRDRPVVILVHGGAWMFGDKDFFGRYRQVGQALARQGLVVVMPNYRLAPWVRHPEHVKDIARAFAWTRKNIEKYGGDPDNLFLAGHSAGGHLAALLATDLSYLEDPALGLDEKARRAVRGVIGVSGVYAIPGPAEVTGVMEKMFGGLASGASPTPPAPASPSSVLRRAGMLLNPFHLVFGPDRQQHLMASPRTHVRPGLPPFLVLYAETELPLLAEMARDFGEALAKAGNDVEVVRVEDRNHDSILFRATSGEDPVARAILRFVEKHQR